MDPLLKLLEEDATLEPSRIASYLNISEEEVAQRIKAYEADQTLLGYQAIINYQKLDTSFVRAAIEVRLSPERGGGFDRLAERIAKHDCVRACYLMSGSYDLLVILEGKDLHEIASFVSEKLATLQGVLSTATHFILKPYKENGVLLKETSEPERLAVSP